MGTNKQSSYRAALIVALVFAFTLHAADTSKPLIDAAKSVSIEKLQALLKAGADVNGVAADGTTALHWATRADNPEAIRILLAAGAKVKAADRYGITPLTLAAENGSLNAVNALLQAGADAKAALPNGETVLMTAARTGSAPVIRALVARGADPNAREKQFGETAVMWAAYENNAAAIRALVEFGADKNAKSSLLKFPEFKFITSGMVTTTLPRGGWTPLMYAARQGAIDAAMALADVKADLDATDPDGATATVLAIINAHFDLAAALAGRGADLNVPDSTGMTAIYAAVDMHTLGPMLSRPGPKIVDKMDAVELVKTLMKHGANADVRLKRPIIGRHHDAGDAQMGEGTTPLVRAFKNFDLPIIRALIEGGADATLTQRDYSTTVMTALSGGGGRGAAPPTEANVLELVTLFLDHGVDVDAFNQTGQTALHLAAGRGYNRVVQLLADRGATLDLKDRQGRTPLDIAAGTGGASIGPGGGRGAPRGGPAPRGAPVAPRGAPIAPSGAAAGPATPNPATAALLRQLIAGRTTKP